MEEALKGMGWDVDLLNRSVLLHNVFDSVDLLSFTLCPVEYVLMDINRVKYSLILVFRF